MYRDLTKGSIAKGLIRFALAGPVGEVGIRIAIPTGWFFADTVGSILWRKDSKAVKSPSCSH